MRCKECDYRLWNLTTQRCPECGAPFLPSDYEFVPNSVAFCCPQCGQAYYGQGPKGHLEPAVFDCVSCGRRVDMNQMVLRPAENIREEQTQADQNPWLRRAERGRVKAWFAMIGRAMVHPGRLIAATAPTSSLLQAFWFVAVTAMATVMWVGIPMVIVGSIAILATGPMHGAPMTAMGPVFGFGAWLLFLLASPIVGILLWGLVAHGVLRVGASPQRGLRGTYQALCYSYGAYAVTGVPCLGFYLTPLGLVWWIVSAILMVKRGQAVGAVRATCAVSLLPVIVVALLTAATGLSYHYGTIAFNTSMTTRTASTVTQAVIDHARQHQGYGPAHGVELLTSTSLSPFDLLDMRSSTLIQNVPVGNTTLDRWLALSANERKAIVLSEINALGPDVIAHRLGDCVFVHHGIDIDTADPALWLVIVHPDPAAGGSAPQQIAVGRVDGSVTTFPAAALAQELQAQNALRAASNLLPLPSPDTVTHGHPAHGVSH